MKCLRCGYCCCNYTVVIVDDPEKEIDEDNLLSHLGGGPCKHLEGKGPGNFKCVVHHYPWYEETPCYEFTQIGEGPCRIGKFILEQK